MVKIVRSSSEFIASALIVNFIHIIGKLQKCATPIKNMIIKPFLRFDDLTWVLIEIKYYFNLGRNELIKFSELWLGMKA